MKSKYCKINELIPKGMSKVNEDKLWALFDDRAIYTLDALRTQFGTLYINDWSFGGDNEFRGFRPPTCKIGATYSQHRFGRGFDVNFKDVTVEEVRQYIIASKTATYSKDCTKYITALEVNVSWLHFDTRNNIQDGLLLFNTKGIVDFITKPL